MKIVIDTNALVNAAGDEYSFANRIIGEVLAGRVQAYANSQTVRENRLIADRLVKDPDYRRKLEDFFGCLQVVDGERVDVVEDREDNKILASALAAAVDFLITSDWHLLKLEKYQGVRVVTPQGFWAEYQEDSGQGWQEWMSKFLG